MNEIKDRLSEYNLIVINIEYGDFNEDNWKVFYKLGLSHGLNKQVLIISSKEEVIHSIRKKQIDCYLYQTSKVQVSIDLPIILSCIQRDKVQSAHDLWYHFAERVFYNFESFTSVSVHALGKELFYQNIKKECHPLLCTQIDIEYISLTNILKGPDGLKKEIKDFIMRDRNNENVGAKIGIVLQNQHVTIEQIREGFEKTEEKIDTLLTLNKEICRIIESNQSILKQLEQKHLNEDKIKRYLDQIQVQLSKLALHNAELATSVNYQNVIKTLKTNADVKGKFKITWALLPKLLTDNTAIPNIVFEKEISWDLKAILEQIVEDFKRGVYS
ncbi:MAG: hypothetical protein IPJ82_14720 [Lewinellaceae bacterium]|nr:hypothetical protein [Lewinellaceae bacterium]